MFDIQVQALGDAVLGVHLHRLLGARPKPQVRSGRALLAHRSVSQSVIQVLKEICRDYSLNLLFAEYSKMAAWIAMNVAVSCLGLAASMKVCEWRYGKKKGTFKRSQRGARPDQHS